MVIKRQSIAPCFFEMLDMLMVLTFQCYDNENERLEHPVILQIKIQVFH